MTNLPIIYAWPYIHILQSKLYFESFCMSDIGIGSSYTLAIFTVDLIEKWLSQSPGHQIARYTNGIIIIY